jgi:hypothetical protein
MRYVPRFGEGLPSDMDQPKEHRQNRCRASEAKPTLRVAAARILEYHDILPRARQGAV